MSIIQGFAEERENERQAGSGPERKVRNDKTITQILGNAADFDNFGQYLASERETELIGKIGKLATGGLDSLSRDDTAELNRVKEDFLMLMERADAVATALDAPTIDKIAKQFPEVKNIVGTVGSEGVRKALTNQFSKLAIQERGHFEALASRVEAYTGELGIVQIKEAIVREAFRKYGVNEQEIIALLRGGDATTIAMQVVGKLIKAAPKMKVKTGFLKSKMVPVMVGIPSVDEIRAEIENLASANERDISDLLQRVEASIQEVGIALEASVMEIPDVNNAIIAQMRGKAIEKPEPVMSFAEVAKTMTVDGGEAKAKFEAMTEKQGEMFVEQLKKEWLQQQKEEKWKTHLEIAEKPDFDKYLQQMVLEKQNEDLKAHLQAAIDAAQERKLLEDFIAADSPDRIAVFRKDFEGTYKAPTPDAALLAKWRAEAQAKVTVNPRAIQHPDPFDMESLQQEAMYDNFERDYTAAHMKGRKGGGFWASVSKEIFKGGLLEGLFGPLI